MNKRNDRVGTVGCVLYLYIVSHGFLCIVTKLQVWPPQVLTHRTQHYVFLGLAASDLGMKTLFDDDGESRYETNATTTRFCPRGHYHVKKDADVWHWVCIRLSFGATCSFYCASTMQWIFNVFASRPQPFILVIFWLCCSTKMQQRCSIFFYLSACLACPC